MNNNYNNSNNNNKLHIIIFLYLYKTPITENFQESLTCYHSKQERSSLVQRDQLIVPYTDLAKENEEKTKQSQTLLPAMTLSLKWCDPSACTTAL